jgi:hypothetical protein
MRFDSGAIPASAQTRIVSYACAVPGISLAELIEQIANFVTRDDVCLLIATGRLYANLHAGLLVEPATVRAFPDRDATLQHGAGRNALPVLHSLLQPFQTLRARRDNHLGGPERSPILEVRPSRYWAKKKGAVTPRLHRRIVDRRMPHHTVARGSRAQHMPKEPRMRSFMRARRISKSPTTGPK